MRADAGGVLDPMDDEGSFDDGDPYTTNLYIGMTYMLLHHRSCCKLVRSAFNHDLCCGSSQCLLSGSHWHEPVVSSENMKAVCLSARLIWVWQCFTISAAV